MQNIGILILLFGATAVVVSAVSCTVTSQMTSQYNTLYALYTATNGPRWYSKCNNNWVFSITSPNYNAPCNGWSGVTCSSNCLVTTLKLGSCNLAGTIPTQLGSMTSMTYLDLSVNSLEGTIPSELSALPITTHLYLSNNSLIGTIPSELSAMTSIQMLNLDSNCLTGTIP